MLQNKNFVEMTAVITNEHPQKINNQKTEFFSVFYLTEPI